MLKESQRQHGDYRCIEGFAQVTENMKSLDVAPQLTAEVLERIEQIFNNKPELVGDFR